MASLATLIDAIPVVVDATDRDARFPLPDWNQRVDNLATGTVQRWSGTAWVPDWNYAPALNAQRFGAKGDGTSDDVVPLQLLASEAVSQSATAYTGPGLYRYSDRFWEITNRCGFQGAGMRLTNFLSLAGYEGYGIRLNDCWRNGAEDAAGLTEINLTTTKVRLLLTGFSMLGSRTRVCRGMQTYDRSDYLLLRDIEFQYLNGTALQLGVVASTNAIVREAYFENIHIRNCGSSTELALDIQNGSGFGDGTNQTEWHGLWLEYNYGVAGRIRSNPSDTNKNVRRHRFFGVMVHGRNTLADAPFCDLFQIAGDVKNVTAVGWHTNGSHKADTAIASNINNSVTTIPLIAGTGATHLGAQPAFPYPMYLFDGTNSETVSVTGRTTDSLTVTRAAEGTSASAFTAAVLTSALASDLTSTATTLALTGGTGASFPATSSVDYLVKLTNGTSTEYVLVTARSTDTLTIQRGKCGSTGTAFLAATPTVVTLLSTLTMRYAALRIAPQTNDDASVDAPQDLSYIGMDIRSCQGHGLVLESGAACEFEGKVIPSDMKGNEARIQDASAVAYGRYALKGTGTRTIFLGTGNHRMHWQEATQPVDGWYQMNVPGTQSVTELTRGAGRWTAKVDGSVCEVWLKLNEVRLTGTITLTLYKNTGLAGAAGSATALVATINGSATSFAQGFSAPFVYTYNEGDELYLAATAASWTPITSDIMNAGFSFMDT